MDKRIEDLIQLQQKGLVEEAKNGYIKIIKEKLSNEDFYVSFINLGTIFFLEKEYSIFEGCIRIFDEYSKEFK